MGVPRRKSASTTGRLPSRLFLKIDRPDIPAEVELRTNWINSSAIAMVTKKQKGNSTHVQILWTCGKTTAIEGKAAHLFLEKWGEQ